jgi:hypothetical protein
MDYNLTCLLFVYGIPGGLILGAIIGLAIAIHDGITNHRLRTKAARRRRK